jgi:hypothetical protein
MRWPARALLLLMALPLCAQQSMPVGILHGHLLSWSDNTFSVQDASGGVYQCGYDKRTFVQRNQWPIRVAQLNEGEPVEVLSDRRAGGCYTRILSVVYTTPTSRRKPVEAWMPTGNLSFAGVVIRSDTQTFTIKMHDGDEKVLHLRPDTHFSGDGVRVDASGSLINKHVFVRAGRGLRGILEAYQVMWGDIFQAP